MSFFLASAVVLVCGSILHLLKLPDQAREVWKRALDSVNVLRDSDLDDAAKEKILRQQAVRLFGLVGILGGGSLLALGLPLFGIWLLELGGVVSLHSVLAVLGRIDFLLGSAVMVSAIYLIFRRLPKP